MILGALGLGQQGKYAWPPLPCGLSEAFGRKREKQTWRGRELRRRGCLDHASHHTSNWACPGAPPCTRSPSQVPIHGRTDPIRHQHFSPLDVLRTFSKLVCANLRLQPPPVHHVHAHSRDVLTRTRRCFITQNFTGQVVFYRPSLLSSRRKSNPVVSSRRPRRNNKSATAPSDLGLLLLARIAFPPLASATLPLPARLDLAGRRWRTRSSSRPRRPPASGRRSSHSSMAAPPGCSPPASSSPST